MIHSYSDIHRLGHPMAKGLLDGPVQVEEKLDGSQISFGIIEGDLVIRSKSLMHATPQTKGTPLYEHGVKNTTDNMFDAAIDTIKSLALTPGYIYRGEYVRKPRHNVLTYGRVPNGFIVLYDVEVAECTYMTWQSREVEAKRLGLEVVPVYFYGTFQDTNAAVDHIKGEFLKNQSMLGGPIEGVVVKNYAKFGPDKKVMMGKYVSAAFDEIKKPAWKADNPTTKDVLDSLVEMLKSEARWQKAVQHGREEGKLVGEMKDLAYLFKEIPADILKEEEQTIRDAFFNYAWPHIKRRVTQGLPEWYQEKLAREASQ